MSRETLRAMYALETTSKTSVILAWWIDCAAMYDIINHEDCLTANLAVEDGIVFA